MKKKMSAMLVSALLVVSGCSSTKPSETTPTNVTATSDTELQSEVVSYQAPYNRIAGYALESDENYKDLPIAVWVDFNPSNDSIIKVQVVGEGNSQLPSDVQELLKGYANEVVSFTSLKANDVKDGETPVEKAIYQACQSYLNTKNKLVIRPYQSMMTSRYLANNPYVVDNAKLSGDVEIETQLVAIYPTQDNAILNEDVKSGDDVKYPAGKNVAKFANDNGEYNISSGVFLAKQPGIAVISYTYDGMTVYDAVDIYENFTLDLTGSDAYGLAIGGNGTDEEITYRVLGDKAMNFPGGTCGSTVIDVTINRMDKTIKNVEVVEHSDSTYLANPWEYEGSFVNTGDFIYNIDQYCAKFVGLSAQEHITPFVVASKDNPEGGTIVDGGIDMVVSGATRTCNAIIYAVNAAIDAFLAS